MNELMSYVTDRRCQAILLASLIIGVFAFVVADHRPQVRIAINPATEEVVGWIQYDKKERVWKPKAKQPVGPQYAIMGTAELPAGTEFMPSDAEYVLDPQ